MRSTAKKLLNGDAVCICLVFRAEYYMTDWISGFAPSASCRTVLVLFAANAMITVFAWPHLYFGNGLIKETNCLTKCCGIHKGLLKGLGLYR